MKDEFEKQLEDILEIEELSEEFELDELDSLGRAELITLAEDTFSVSLSNKDILEAKTYGDLMKLINLRRQ
jgi:acyl carrier protein